MYIRISLLIVFLIVAAVFINTQHQSTVSAQLPACPPVGTPRADGLVSAHANLQGLSNPWQQCITGGRVAFSPFDITNFKGLVDTFYIGSTSLTKQAPPAPFGASFNQSYINIPSTNRLLYLSSDLEIFGPIAGTGTGVIFVNGKLDIKTNICYGNPTPSVPHVPPLNPDCPVDPSANSKGLVFVVSGPINIYAGVNIINAILISSNDISTTPNDPVNGTPNPTNDTSGVGYNTYGYTICTYYDPSLLPNHCPPSKVALPLPNPERLIINGSLISLNDSKNISFRRDLNDNSANAAEDVIAQAKYFALLKDLFTRPGSVTTTNTHYSELVAP